MIVVSVVLICSSHEAFAQPDGAGHPHNFWSYVVFWSGGVFIMYLMGRKMFREHLGERRTLRRLIDEIGPIYPDFDIDSVKKWVHLCAPHVWVGWSRGGIDTIDDFVTDYFRTRSRDECADFEAKGLTRDVELEGILKIHPVDLALIGPGPAPMDVQLTLRLEVKARHAVVRRDNQLVSGSRKVRQVQYFWRIVHDGDRWRLHEVWPAEDDFRRADDAVDVPQITQWRQPVNPSGGES